MTAPHDHITSGCRLVFTRGSRWWDTVDQNKEAIVCSAYESPLRVGVALVNENGEQLPCIKLKPLLVYHDMDEHVPQVFWTDKNSKTRQMSEPLRKVSVELKNNICFCEGRPVASSDQLGKRRFQVLYVFLLSLLRLLSPYMEPY